MFLKQKKSAETEANISKEKQLVKTIINPDNKEDVMGEINPEIASFVDNYQQELIRPKTAYTPIHVDEIASRAARFYEQIRKIIDWKDDNALRRGAIERILKRIIFPKLKATSLKPINTEKLAKTITNELIRGGHLPNDTIPQEIILVIKEAMEKYIYFLNYTISHHESLEVKDKSHLTNTIMEIAACEIEEILTNPIKEYGLMYAATQILDRLIILDQPETISAEEKHKQIYIAIARTLYDLDDNFIIFQLLKNRYPNWHQPKPEETEQMAQSLPETIATIRTEIDQPISRKMGIVAEKIDTVFMLLDDVLEKLKDRPGQMKSVLENKTKFARLINDAYDQRYRTLKTRLLHSAIFSTLSVFISNWFTFFVVEVPLAKLFYEGFDLLAAIVDFLIPTLIMFALVVIIKPPKEDNAQKVVNTTLKFMYQDEEKERFLIKVKNDKPLRSKITMGIIYSISTLSSFASIAYIFYIAHLPVTSIIFDTFTIALTVFAAVTIKNKSKELNVDDQSGFNDFLLDVATVPVAKVGQFFARKWKEYNVVATFSNFVIDAPFATTLDFIQELSEYIKEKRAELH
jgi:chorismate mutase